MACHRHTLVCGMMALACARPAWANDRTTQEQEDRTSGATIPEIIVTAQKRAQALEKTPLSIGVVTGEEIEKKAQTTLEGALKDVPSVEMQTISQGVQLYIRGVGSSIDPGFADPAVALTIDGVYNGRTEALGSGAFDIERIEVLRGPQGTLYGRNASGGLVNVITRDPRLNEWSASARLQLGNYALRRGEAMLNVPLGQDLALRLASYREMRDGYIDDGSMDSNSWGARAKVLYEPAGWLRIVGKFDIFRENDHGPNTVPVPGNAGNLGFPDALFSAWTGWENGWPQRDPGNPWSNDPQHAAPTTKNRGESYALQVDADLGPATLTLLPSYTRLYHYNRSNYIFGSLGADVEPTNDDSGYTPAAATTFYKSLETRLTSNSGSRLQYILGFYYLHTNPGTPLAPQDFTDSNNIVIGTFSQTVEPGSTIAGFGQVTYAVLPRLRLTGGLRYSRDTNAQSYDVTLESGDTAAADTAASQTSTQYKLGLEYDAGAHWLIYAHVASGFKQGGQSVTIPPQSFKPEHLTAFEVGSKSQLLNGRASLNLAAFHYHYVDYQYSAFVPLEIASTGYTANFFLVQNAGPTHINGAEAQLNARLWKGGHLSLSGT